jgi:hypothetical protein
MKTISIILSFLLLIPFSVPARADFKYTEKATITGGALIGAAKLAAVFSKESRQALQPTTTTHYIKGNRLRSDNSEGTIQIVDLDARRIIEIDPQKKTYSIMTFDEMKAAMEKAQQQMEQEIQKQKAKNPNQQSPQVTLIPKFQVLPETGSSRVILGQNTTETKVQMDMEMQAQPTEKAGTPKPTSANSGQPAGPVDITWTLTMDTWVAPSVSGYQEYTQFAQRMAKEVNWTPPTIFHIDPRMAQGLTELQKNSAAFKGLPLLSYLTMAMPQAPGQPQNTADSSNKAEPPKSADSNSSDTMPTTASGAVIKGLGGLFGKKKQKQENSSTQETSSTNPPRPSNPNSLMDMTMEVVSFSDSSLESSLFEVPSGYTQVQRSADQLVGTQPKH